MEFETPNHSLTSLVVLLGFVGLMRTLMRAAALSVYLQDVSTESGPMLRTRAMTLLLTRDQLLILLSGFHCD